MPENDQKVCPQCGQPIPDGAAEGLCPACLLKSGLSETSPGPTQPEAPIETLTPEELEREFPQYEVLSLLGQGGMGTVYKARHRNLDRIVALKILAAKREGDPGFAERFQREARSLARLNHPHIVTVYDFGQTESGRAYLVMEFVEGITVRQAEREGKLTPQEALAIVPQICDALQAAHDEGIVHRDIKPENILLDKRGKVKIADFGIAKIVGQAPRGVTLTDTGLAVGTPNYMAPEQLNDPQHVDHRADIYSLGVVFYEMLTGELPMGRFASPSQKVHVDVRLDEVVLRALEREPERRYQRAQDVKTRVETIASGAGSESEPKRRQHWQMPEWDNYSRWTPMRHLVFWLSLLGFIGFGRVADYPWSHLKLGPETWWPTICVFLTALSWICLAVAVIPWGKWSQRAPTSPALTPEQRAKNAARFSVSGPAVCLLIVSGLNLIGVVAFVAVKIILEIIDREVPFFEVVSLPILAAITLCSAVTIFGAIKMLHFDARPLAMAGAVGAMITPTPFIIVSLPAGLWALSVLTNPRIKRVFEETQASR